MDKAPVNYLKDGIVGEFLFTRVDQRLEEKTSLNAAGQPVKQEKSSILFKLVLDKGSVTKDAYASDYDPSGDVILWGTTVAKTEKAPRGMRDFIPYSTFKIAFRFAAQKGLSTGKDSLPIGTCFVRVRLGANYDGNAKNFIADIGGEEVKVRSSALAEASASLARSIINDEDDQTGPALSDDIMKD